MTINGKMLLSLENIMHETTVLEGVLEQSRNTGQSDRHEIKRRIISIRTGAQELFDWLSAARLDETRN